MLTYIIGFVFGNGLLDEVSIEQVKSKFSNENNVYKKYFLGLDFILYFLWPSSEPLQQHQEHCAVL